MWIHKIPRAERYVLSSNPGYTLPVESIHALRVETIKLCGDLIQSPHLSHWIVPVMPIAASNASKSAMFQRIHENPNVVSICGLEGNQGCGVNQGSALPRPGIVIIYSWKWLVPWDEWLASWGIHKPVSHPVGQVMIVDGEHPPGYTRLNP